MAPSRCCESVPSGRLGPATRAAGYIRGPGARQSGEAITWRPRDRPSRYRQFTIARECRGTLPRHSRFSGARSTLSDRQLAAFAAPADLPAPVAPLHRVARLGLVRVRAASALRPPSEASEIPFPETHSDEVPDGIWRGLSPVACAPAASHVADDGLAASPQRGGDRDGQPAAIWTETGRTRDTRSDAVSGIAGPRPRRPGTRPGRSENRG
jgi:hypothetical protein